jgi:catechol 2,3-dioxygenase-like lactoylglutathione lyase family enzyme
MGLLERALVESTIPAQDLDRARAYYAEKLGLTPSSEGRIGLRYRLADGTRFRLFRSGGRAAGSHTQMALLVEDLVAVVPGAPLPRCPIRGVRRAAVDDH